ncbi:hypothetical protein ACFY5J_12300 [Peribacillus butanolivorans]|uniref:hypothetical protein n=1 Tax=Peribacillus butanolivorans TaxID=421767 RepID=UPI003696C769
MKNFKELKAYAISDDFKFHVTEVVISHSKDVALYWLRDQAGYTNEEMSKFKVREVPLDKRVYVKDYGETSAQEMIEEVVRSEAFRSFPIVVFSRKVEDDYYENWHSHYELEEPTD